VDVFCLENELGCADLTMAYTRALKWVDEHAELLIEA